MVKDSDHHMYLDNPEHFAQVIIEDIHLYLEYELLSVQPRGEVEEQKQQSQI